MLDWLWPPNYWAWWALGVVLAAIEILTPGTYLLWPGLAAGVVGVLALLAPGLDWRIEVVVWVALSIISVIAARRYLKRHPTESDQPTLNRRASSLIGRSATLVEAITDGRGRAKLGDGTWSVTGPELPAGTHVKVVGADGAVLKVEAA
jgi:membrane protein implicated in regulation of membrane protease activity